MRPPLFSGRAAAWAMSFRNISSGPSPWASLPRRRRSRTAYRSPWRLHYCFSTYAEPYNFGRQSSSEQLIPETQRYSPWRCAHQKRGFEAVLSSKGLKEASLMKEFAYLRRSTAALLLSCSTLSTQAQALDGSPNPPFSEFARPGLGAAGGPYRLDFASPPPLGFPYPDPDRLAEALAAEAADIGIRPGQARAWRDFTVAVLTLARPPLPDEEESSRTTNEEALLRAIKVLHAELTLEQRAQVAALEEQGRFPFPGPAAFGRLPPQDGLSGAQ